MFEKQLRLVIMLSLLSGLVGGVIATFFLVGSSVVAQPTPADTSNTAKVDIPKTITAQEFRLVDTRGRVRAMLAFTEDGQPFLQLPDEFDTYRVWMGISTDTGVALRDVDGKTRLVMSLD